MMGFGNLVFAGGRDTIIHSISSIIAYLAKTPLLWIICAGSQTDCPCRRGIFSCLYAAHAYRAGVPGGHEVHGVPVKAGGRVSLAWASANFDETVFDAPEEIRLDRKPNPHLSFGFGPHLCLGASHARLIVRSLLETLAGRVERITVLKAKQHIEHEARYDRENGYDSLTVAFKAR